MAIESVESDSETDSKVLRHTIHMEAFSKVVETTATHEIVAALTFGKGRGASSLGRCFGDLTVGSCAKMQVVRPVYQLAMGIVKVRLKELVFFSSGIVYIRITHIS